MESSKVYIQDVATDSLLETVLTVTATPVEAKVGATALTNRILLVIYNSANQKVYWGTSTVTPTSGIPIYKKQTFFLPTDENVPIYLCLTTGSSSVHIKEFA